MDDKRILFAQVDEIGVILFCQGELFPNIIELPWHMWDAMLNMITRNRTEIEAEIAAGNKVEPAPLRMPNFNDIDFKNFPR